MELIRELWEFLKVKKQVVLAFIILVFLLLGAFIVFSETSVLAPLIYTVF